MWPLDDVVAELLAEQVEVDRSHEVAVAVDALDENVGEQVGDLIDVCLREVG